MARRVRLVALGLALVALAVSLAWLRDLPVLAAIANRGTLRPSAAVAFILAAGALALMTIRETPARLIVASICISGIGYLMTLSLIAALLGRPTRTGIGTAVVFLIFTAVGWLTFFASSWTRTRYWLTHAILFIGALALVGHMLGWPALYWGLAQPTAPMSELTAICFIVLGFGLRWVTVKPTRIVFEPWGHK